MNKTAQRDAILDELCKVTTHPTADELYAQLRRRMPKISLGTVYRNLEQLSQLGIIQKLATNGKQKRFDGNAALHHHMRCQCCDRIVDVEHEALSKVNEVFDQVLPEVGFHSFYLEFQGICPECKTKKA